LPPRSWQASAWSSRETRRYQVSKKASD